MLLFLIGISHVEKGRVHSEHLTWLNIGLFPIRPSKQNEFLCLSCQIRITLILKMSLGYLKGFTYCLARAEEGFIEYFSKTYGSIITDCLIFTDANDMLRAGLMKDLAGEF